MRPRLRLYTGEEGDRTVEEPQVSMRLRDITRILNDAWSWDRTWLNDFADDEVQVSSDLYDVLSSYSHLRPSA